MDFGKYNSKTLANKSRWLDSLYCTCVCGSGDEFAAVVRFFFFLGLILCFLLVFFGFYSM